jgi:DNA-binding protein
MSTENPPSTETQTPSTETQTPSTETQTPSTETQTPSTETQTPSTETQTPSSETQTQSTETKRESGNRDTIYIGKKPLMAYVTSSLIQLANLSAVRIKARGMSIGRAVDVAQIISRKTENAGYIIGEIKIDSEVLESKDGKSRNVSTIDIEVKRK